MTSVSPPPAAEILVLRLMLACEAEDPDTYAAAIADLAKATDLCQRSVVLTLCCTLQEMADRYEPGTWVKDTEYRLAELLGFSAPRPPTN